MTVLAPPPTAQYLICNKLNYRYYFDSNQTVPRHHQPIPRLHSFFDTLAERHTNRGSLFITEAFWQQDIPRPTSVEMEPIMDCDQFDQILKHAQELSQPIAVDWMAAWCRKCIFLKPKLEKLAAEFDTKVKFYYVDVNKVPQALVKRGNVTKMPTIQVWKDGEMKEEVIGGHQAWLVIEEVREMIRKYV